MTRVELQAKFEELLGSSNVYYQPPESLKIKYPAIVYSKEGMTKKSAGDSAYTIRTRYKVTYVDTKASSGEEMSEKLLSLPRSTYYSHYASEGLYHDVFGIYA